MARRRSASPRDLIDARGASLFGYARALAGDNASELLECAAAAVFSARRPPADVGEAESATLTAMRRTIYSGKVQPAPPRPPHPAAGSPELSDALASLDPRDRVCAVMRLFDDATLAAIAVEVGDSEASALAHTSSGLSSLERERGDLGIPDDARFTGGTETLVVTTRAYGSR